MAARRRSAGFTLIELMVALFVLALVAMLSWRGLDGMVRAQEVTQARADEIHGLQIGLAQWSTDLDALVQLPQLPAIDWNGRVLRLTRPASAAANEGVIVVGWSRRVRDGAPRWMRWQSPPLTTRGQVEDAWARADAWAQGQGGAEDAAAVAVTALDNWQVFYYRADAWTNPLSSDAMQATGTPSSPGPVGSRAPQIPDGVRIVLSLPGGQAITGDLVRDWVRPTLGGGKS
ncbi:prepilin-type N-terminal cleavage/methylation domain-containing protein [Ramlibacter henchirensis]|uniref:Prepilin-type N-terminal cleavage/methylation domain-containing protein n=1 Tax=Ramlibacter henchirensis TaxID=204072 RepID=A0A4Z0C903_9BURK|nr:prepilin-type N-terminal cleavage/methylation domain-containing protein [Ramlibacter henchirensis]TFZ06575.1 prepilin-type N-terminal cleavage/methylation domain-containing protein [Ramlibacter henchirensis]